MGSLDSHEDKRIWTVSPRQWSLLQGFRQESAMIRCVIGDGFEQDRPVGRLALLSGGHDEGASRCGSRI